MTVTMLFARTAPEPPAQLTKWHHPEPAEIIPSSDPEGKEHLCSGVHPCAFSRVSLERNSLPSQTGSLFQLEPVYGKVLRAHTEVSTHDSHSPLPTSEILKWLS